MTESKSKAKIKPFLIQHSPSAGSYSPPRVIMPGSWIKKHQVPTRKPIQLRFGTARHQVLVQPHPAKSLALHLPSGLAKQWGIPRGIRLKAEYRSEEETLHLGPLLAVMVNQSYNVPDKLFGSNTGFCKELADTCLLQGGMVYFFSADQVRTSSEKLTGWTFAGQWRKLQFPLPDVIYNRLSTRKIENRPEVKRFIQNMLSQHQIRTFNEKFLDKHEVFNALGADESLQPYLPESRLLKNFDTFRQMCEKYPVVFLKPVRGSLGKGIIRITRRSEGGLTSEQPVMNRTRTRHAANATRMYKHLAPLFKAGRYQIQQGVPILSCEGRPVDFRALVQKNGKGEWSITSIVGRIAAPKHFVSNLARGGSLNSVRNVLAQSKLSADKAKTVQTQLKTIALKLAEGVEQHIPHHFGELGVDLAVEPGGRVWLLEINSKPSKSDNTALSPNTSVRARPSVRRVIQYVTFLSQF